MERIVDLDTGKAYKIPLTGSNSKPNVPPRYGSPSKATGYPGNGTAESTPACERDREYHAVNGKSFSTPERTSRKRSQKDSPDFVSPVTPGTAYTGYSRSVLDSAVGVGPPLYPRPGQDKFSPSMGVSDAQSSSSPHKGTAITLTSLEDHMRVGSGQRRGAHSQERSSSYLRAQDNGFSPQQILYDASPIDSTPSALSRSGLKNTRRKTENRDREMCIENSRGASNYVRREDGSPGWGDTPAPERRRQSADNTPSPNKRERKKKMHEYSPSDDRQGHKGTIAEKPREDAYVRTAEMDDSPQTHTDRFMQRQRAEKQAEFDRRVQYAVAVSQGQKMNGSGSSPPIGDLAKSTGTSNTNPNKKWNSTPSHAPKAAPSAPSSNHPQGHSRPYRDQGAVRANTADHQQSPHVPQPFPASTSIYSTPERNGRGSINNSPSTAAAAASMSRVSQSSDVYRQVPTAIAAADDDAAHYSPVVSRIVNGWHTSYSQPGQYGQQRHPPR